MPQQEADAPMEQQEPSNTQTILFMVLLSLVCATILSSLASALEKPKEMAKDLDRSKQTMIAAKIFSHEGYFLLPDGKGGYEPAKYQDGMLVAGSPSDIAAKDQILEIYRKRLIPAFVDSKGELVSVKDSGIDLDNYLAAYKKVGYYTRPWKLIYLLMPNVKKISKEDKPIGYVIPVNGLGLWDAIYGYLAIKPDGNTVIGISWYDQKETPGLGANIAEAAWQANFPGKVIFHPNADGTTDVTSAPLGIVVVKGNVSDVLGMSPKAKSAVDGMAGATLTGNGVTDAYKDVLAAYRPFLEQLNKASKSSK